MPSRIVRDGILTSERVNALSPLAELFYRRLMSVADDHGRYSANLTQLRAYCFPLKLDKVKESAIREWLDECVKHRLVVLYSVGGKDYLQMVDFGQRINGKSKYPEPPEIPGVSPGFPGDFRLGGDVVGGEDEGDSGAAPAEPTPPPAITLPLVDKTEFPITEDQVAEFRDLYPAVDVRAALREMRGWCLGNPTKRKTRSGILRFVTTWLAKEQNKGGTAGHPPAIRSGSSASNPGGTSPRRPETAASKLEGARSFAEGQQQHCGWTKADADAYLAPYIEKANREARAH